MSIHFIVQGHPEDHGGGTDVPVLVSIRMGSARRSALTVDQMMLFDTQAEAEAVAMLFTDRRTVVEIERLTDEKVEEIIDEVKPTEEGAALLREKKYLPVKDGIVVECPGRAPKPDVDAGRT